MKLKDLQEFGIEAPSEGKLIIDVSSEWCGPCKLLSPILENFRDKKLIELIQIDLFKDAELIKYLGVTNVPTLLFFKNGKLLDHNIEIDGYTIVKNGVMVGTAGEIILEEIIKKM